MTEKTHREQAIELIDTVERMAMRYERYYGVLTDVTANHYENLQAAKVDLINFICGEDE